MYIGAIPTPAATESRQEFTATANQTVFSTTGGTVGFCDCFLNGVRMANSDFSFDGADVTLTTGAAAGDVLAVVMRQADNALVALPIKDSAGNNVLSESGGVVTLSDSVKHTTPIVRTWLSANQSISSGSQTKVGFDIDTPQSGADAYKTAIDTHSFFNATGSTVNGIPSHSFLPTIAGYYFVNLQLGLDCSSAGSYYLAFIRKNGGTYSQHYSIWGGITRYSANLSAVVHMDGSSDYLDFAGYIQANSPFFQASGGTNTHAEIFLIQRD